MPNYTKNYNLIKPNKTENYDIEDVTNKNMDILDEELFGKEDKVPGKGLSTNDFTNEYKNKLDGLENYDDTELINKLNEQVQKNNLQEQKIEELQSQITNLQEENTQLKDQIPTGEASGNPTYINDSSNLEAKLRLNGGDKQETREGNNLLNFNVEQSSSRVTVNADGTLTINGTGGFNLNIEEITLKTGITYYQKWQLVSGSITGVTDPFLSVLGSGGYITQNAFLQATTTEDVNKNTIWVHTSAVFENAVVKIWANTDQSDFEQYGAMPSPGYPSKVETVGSNINLFDGEMEKGTINDTTGVNEHEDWQVVRSKNYINVKGLKNITLSLVHASNTVIFFDSLKSVISHNAITTKNIRTVELPENCEYIRFYEWVVDLNSKRKIEPGNQATPYSPYNMGSVEIEKSNKQLFNIKDLVKGIGALNLDEEDFVTVSGDNTTGNSQYYNVYTNPSKLIKPNAKYYLVLEIKEITGTGNILPHSFSETNYRPQFSGSKNYSFASLKAGDIKIEEITSLENLEDSTNMIRTFLSFNTGQSGSITFRISVLEEEPTAETFEYTKHEQQTKIMYTQQEMLEGDYIEDVEHHEWEKVVLDGTENWALVTENAKMIKVRAHILNNVKNSNIGICNYFKVQLEATSQAEDGGISIYENDIALYVWILKSITSTVDDFKVWLQNLYNEGKPVILYYKTTPLDLELTEAQKEAQKINTYKNVTNIVVDNNLATLDVTYKKDQETLNKNYEDRIAALEAAILS